MRTRSILALSAALALGACSLPAADKESDGEARALFEEIRTGADITQDTHLAPDLKTPDRVQEFADLKAHLPPGAPTKVENRSWKYNTTNDGSIARLVHAYVYPGHTVFTETVLHKGPGEAHWTIAGFHASMDAPPSDNSSAD